MGSLHTSEGFLVADLSKILYYQDMNDFVKG